MYGRDHGKFQILIPRKTRVLDQFVDEGHGP